MVWLVALVLCCFLLLRGGCVAMGLLFACLHCGFACGVGTLAICGLVGCRFVVVWFVFAFGVSFRICGGCLIDWFDYG